MAMMGSMKRTRTRYSPLLSGLISVSPALLLSRSRQTGLYRAILSVFDSLFCFVDIANAPRDFPS